MDNKIIILGLVTLIIFLSGCIQSNVSNIDGLSPSINTHLKNGDQYFNNASYDTNKFSYTMALSNCNNATAEYNQARSLASEGLTYANNSNNTVYSTYMQLVLDEIDSKINATNELRIAIPSLENNDTVNANLHIGNANTFMSKATDFYNQRADIVKQNPTKFK